MPYVCPSCGVRLDYPSSIVMRTKGSTMFRLTDAGLTEQTGTVVTKRGSYECRGCSRRLNKFLKEVRVGMIGEKTNAANAAADV